MASDLFNLSGEIAVVIGGTGVLGGAIAEALAPAGAKVAILGRNADNGELRAKRIRGAGGQSHFFPADAMSKESLSAARQAVEMTLGSATILVNAAGGTDPNATVTAEKPLEALPLESWRNNFDLNLVGGVLLPCQEFAPGMLSRGKGSIINIARSEEHTSELQ